MKICMIAEGSYPYITGGVSSWINMIIRAMPEMEFIIFAIAPEEKMRGIFKYEIPSNVIEIHEVFLDSWKNEPVRKRSNLKFTDKEKLLIKDLILGHAFDWNEMFDLVRNKKVSSVQDFLLSKDFFDIVYSAYVDSFSQTPFTEYFWTMRSMLLPLFHIIKHDVPEADIYHAPSTGYAGIVASQAKLSHGKKLIVTEHGIYTREREIEIIKATWMKNYYKDMWIEFFYNLSRCAYDHADQVVTLFGKNREVEVALGCDREKIMIIPNGVDYEGFSALKKDTSGEPIQNKGLQGTYSVGAIVRVVPIKDLKTMIKAFAIVKGTMPNVSFYIIGPTEEDEDYYDECLTLVEDLSLKDVIFTGKVDVKQYIPNMDLFVLSSISEGQPLSVLETMASGKVNVTTDVGCCKELLYGDDDLIGRAGRVVPIMDFTAMAKEIIRLLSDGDLREEMSISAMERVSLYYRLERMIDGYRNLYLDVVK